MAARIGQAYARGAATAATLLPAGSSLQRLRFGQRPSRRAGEAERLGIRLPELPRRLPIPLPEPTREMAWLRKAAASCRFRYGHMDEPGIAQNLPCMFQAKSQQLFIKTVPARAHA